MKIPGCICNSIQITGIGIAKTLREWDCKDKHFYPYILAARMKYGSCHKIIESLFLHVANNKTQNSTLHVLTIAVKYGKVVLAQKILVTVCGLKIEPPMKIR